MDQNELLWRLYESEREFIRHHENQRTNASSILAAISAALVVAVSSDAINGWVQLMISFTIAGVGIFGSIFSGKLYELIQLHAGRSYLYLDQICDEFPNVDARAVKLEMKERHSKKYPRTSKASLNKIWLRFHLLVALMGVILSATIAISLSESHLALLSQDLFHQMLAAPSDEQTLE